MERLQPTIPKYIEVKHQAHVDSVRDNYVMLQSVKINLDGAWTCPAKTIAIFAHDTEFSFADVSLPNIVSTVST